MLALIWLKVVVTALELLLELLEEVLLELLEEVIKLLLLLLDELDVGRLSSCISWK